MTRYYLITTVSEHPDVLNAIKTNLKAIHEIDSIIIKSNNGQYMEEMLPKIKKIIE